MSRSSPTCVSDGAVSRRAGLRPTRHAVWLSAFALIGSLWAPLAQAVLPIEHWTTSRGARVYFVRADAIPMLDVDVGFDAGSRHDPPAKAGLAAMTMGMLARGVEGFDEAMLAERFADLGAVTVAPNLQTPEALGRHLKAEIDKWTPIIRKAGVYAD